MYGNRLLCSTEYDALLSNLGVYGNFTNDPRFSENVNMLIQMYDGIKQQNRSTLTTSYIIPEWRRATIIGASVGDPYARVSQQNFEWDKWWRNFFTFVIFQRNRYQWGTQSFYSLCLPSAKSCRTQCSFYRLCIQHGPYTATYLYCFIPTRKSTLYTSSKFSWHFRC